MKKLLKAFQRLYDLIQTIPSYISLVEMLNLIQETFWLLCKITQKPDI